MQITRRLTPVYEVLSETDVQKIIDATFQLMREIGVGFDPDPKVLDLFADASCDITSNNAVKFDRGLVEECLETVSKSAKAWNRDATDYLEIQKGETSFIPGRTSPPSPASPMHFRTSMASACRSKTFRTRPSTQRSTPFCQRPSSPTSTSASP